MRRHPSHPASWLLALLVLAPLTGQRLTADEDGPPALPGLEQPEVLSRGPVHEAFAEPVNLQVQLGLVAAEPPPPNIDEVPPAERPQGQQFAWIPGYWSWDADRNGYIWVSACWRAAPPKMSWMPGYWSPVPRGWEWIAGFWAPAGVRELEYLPAPPVVDDVEPRGTPPSADMIWVPPCMYWGQGRYARRSGYWLPAQSDWVWVPSHYVATPRGYVFAEGHWDYSLERRGVLFAPVFFPAAMQGRSDFTYTPSVVLDMGLLRVSLFAYPQYSHYYFGDYYDDAYRRVGIQPWFDSARLRTWYDPLYEHERWLNGRSEPRWEDRQRDDYKRRLADQDLRPARTFREQESRLARLPEPQRRAAQVVRPFAGAVEHRETPLKYERISPDARQRIATKAGAVRTFRDERNRWESDAPRPPAALAPRVREGTVEAPPRRPEAPPPGVEPPGPSRREAAPPRPRQAEAPQAERVQIPPPPAAGRSGLQDIFRRGPPTRPADEGRDAEGRDFRRGKASERDSRGGRGERRDD